MKQWNIVFAVALAMGLAATPFIVHADQHEKTGTTEEQGTHAEGSDSHSHHGAKAEGKAAVKEASSPEEGSSSGHSHGSQAEKKEEGSH